MDKYEYEALTDSILNEAKQTPDFIRQSVITHLTLMSDEVRRDLSHSEDRMAESPEYRKYINKKYKSIAKLTKTFYKELNQLLKS